jgi:adsorption protein B
LEWLALCEHELLLFAGIFFLVGIIDELLVDGIWIWLKLSGRTKAPPVDRRATEGKPLKGKVAVMIPAWQEAEVIGTTVEHMLSAWPQAELRLYVGHYRNDPETALAALRGAGEDSRVRLVMLERDGPTTKADCLNRLYRALGEDEAQSGEAFRMVLLHDAEDMVDAAALAVLDEALDDAEFVQIPVRPEPQPDSRWIAGHYCEEFAEAHAKAMVVRGAVHAALPAAGVGCAFSRPILARLAEERSEQDGPFSIESLTEDYELGLRIKAMGARTRFLRLRGDDGQLIATRACFPAQLGAAVRQKTRWIHGIALQGWDRLGWIASPVELWMRMRDRRGPLTAIVLSAAYLLLGVAALLWAAGALGLGRPWQPDPLAHLLIVINFIGFLWRAGMRFAFTAREYGWGEGVRSVLRIPVANIIAIMAGRRALFAYMGTLGGKTPEWDKTTHLAHPATMRAERTA